MAVANKNFKNVFINITPKERPRKKKYCWFKKNHIKYIDYKDPQFLLKFVDEHGRITPRRYTGTSLKYQRMMAVSIKRARHLALLPFVSDSLK
jgi:small subunit ribosomal protein S18